MAKILLIFLFCLPVWWGARLHVRLLILQSCKLGSMRRGVGGHIFCNLVILLHLHHFHHMDHLHHVHHLNHLWSFGLHGLRFHGFGVEAVGALWFMITRARRVRFTGLDGNYNQFLYQYYKV